MATRDYFLLSGDDDENGEWHHRVMDEIEVRHWLITERSGDARWAKAFSNPEEQADGSVIAYDVESGEQCEIPESYLNVFF